MAFTFKLQSPAYKENPAGGTQILLPVSVESMQGNSMAAIITLFKGSNKIMDFAQLREIIQIGGVLTDGAAADAGFDNAVHFRDALRSVRADKALKKSDGSLSSPWTTEAAVESETWATGITTVAEQDSSTNRADGLIRLIADKAWDDQANALRNLMIYGTIGDIAFGPRAAASLRTRIPYKITFLVGNAIVVGQ